jgi:hypothetical protein
MDRRVRKSAAMISKRTLLFGCFAVMGCATATGDFNTEGDEGDSVPVSAPIVGGTTASAYPEAVLLDMYTAGASYPSSICSAAVITPRVVLTAGHCVTGFVKWRVKAPFAGNQSAYASSGGTFDWSGTSSSVDPNKHDVGLVYLDTPINLTTYPTVASAGSAEGTNIVNIGRIQDGVASNTSLFVGKSLPIQNGSKIGYPYDYYTTEIIQPGDSGGPNEVAGTHKIISVNSGAGSGTQVLARVDLVYSWIDTQVKSHGGWAGSSTPPPPSPPSTPTCANKETEANDSYTTPNALNAGDTCGSVSGGNQDWFTWSVGTTAVSYSLKLAATGDAQIQMWKLSGGQYYAVANNTPTEISKTSNGAGSYVVVVYSPSSTAQTYTLNLKR